MGVSRISSQFAKSPNALRVSLQKTSALKNLNTRMIRDEGHRHLVNMLIPDGMTIKEKLVYGLTNQYPKSVTDRWIQISDQEAQNIVDGSEVVWVERQALSETGYFDRTEFVADDMDDNSDDEGFIDKIMDFIF